MNSTVYNRIRPMLPQYTTITQSSFRIHVNDRIFLFLEYHLSFMKILSYFPIDLWIFVYNQIQKYEIYTIHIIYNEKSRKQIPLWKTTSIIVNIVKPFYAYYILTYTEWTNRFEWMLKFVPSLTGYDVQTTQGNPTKSWQELNPKPTRVRFKHFRISLSISKLYDRQSQASMSNCQSIHYWMWSIYMVLI